MTAEQMKKALIAMDNKERGDYLDWVYDEYFDTGITPEQRSILSQLWEAYNDGEIEL